ncbi:hypothetical protein Z043_107504, partial [Scleropages formosus]
QGSEMPNLVGHSTGKADKKYDKCMKPGWRIEQKYSNKVLIGNWVEDRLQFSRECGAPRSIHRQDYRPHKDHQPNVIVQRASLRRAEGLPGKLLLGHHGAPHSHYLVSVYGETYGRQTCGTLPTLQSCPSDDLQADGVVVPPMAKAKKRRACADHIPCFIPTVAPPANTCQSAKAHGFQEPLRKVYHYRRLMCCYDSKM